MVFHAIYARDLSKRDVKVCVTPWTTHPMRAETGTSAIATTHPAFSTVLGS